MSKLKVYGISTTLGGNARSEGQVRAVVAASSTTEAARIMGCTVGHFRKWAYETGDPDDIETAMADPGAVFWQSERGPYNPAFTRWEPRS